MKFFPLLFLKKNKILILLKRNDKKWCFTMKSLILFLVVFSFDSLAVSGVQELQEIKIFGDYYAGDPKEIEDSERYYRERGFLEEGETLADKPQTAHMLENLGKERFRIGKKSMIYCYEKILDLDEDRESAPVFNPDLRARMYDKEGNLLAEDVLRDGNPGRSPFAKHTVAYLPYLKNGDVIIRIVRLEGEKEVLLYERTGIYSHEILKEHDQSDLHAYGYAYKFYPTNELIKIPCYR